jgi:hypothetical protein
LKLFQLKSISTPERIIDEADECITKKANKNDHSSYHHPRSGNHKHIRHNHHRQYHHHHHHQQQQQQQHHYRKLKKNQETSSISMSNERKEEYEESDSPCSGHSGTIRRPSYQTNIREYFF